MNATGTRGHHEVMAFPGDSVLQLEGACVRMNKITGLQRRAALLLEEECGGGSARL